MLNDDPFSPINTQDMHGHPLSKKDEGVAITPIPDDVILDVPKHPLGVPSMIWDYRDPQGKGLFRVCRFIDGNGNKEDRPLTYRHYSDGSKRWAWKGLKSPRPLYGLDRLADNLTAPVIVCEGEKATDAATHLFPDCVAVTSPNGAGSPHIADWKPLAGRQIIIWPDYDDEGRKYAQNVAQCSLNVGVDLVSIVTIPPSFPPKWDLADDLPDDFALSDLQRFLDEAIPVQNPLYGLVGRTAIRQGAAFEPEVIEALLDLKQQDRGGFETLRSQLRKVGVRVSELDKVLAETNVENGGGQSDDHLSFARQVIQSIGSQNLLGTTSHTWKWDNKGVWRNMADRAIKQDVQRSLEQYGHDVTRSLVDAVTDVLKTEIYAPYHEWDNNQDIVNVRNGELHWNGQEFVLKPHDRCHYQTTQIPVAYDYQADCPRFIQFLHEVFRDDRDGEEKARALCEMIGYTLFSHARLERFALLVGSGANGKSVLLEVVRALIGRDNVAAVQPSQFSNKFQRAHLHMKLANLVTEIAEGGEIADAELKAIVSGELTTAEHKNKDPFDFTPFCTCWFGTNHMPHIRDFSDALFRRALVIPFNRTFKGVDADPNLKITLLSELSGIMNVALQAFGEVLKRGQFTEPESCLKAKSEWRLEADQVAQFIEERCVPDAGSCIKSADFYMAYNQWTQDAGISRKLNRKNFSNRLVRLGATLHKGTGGMRSVTGFRFLSHKDQEVVA